LNGIQRIYKERKMNHSIFSHRTATSALATAFSIIALVAVGCSGYNNSTGYDTTDNQGGGTPGALEVWAQSVQFTPSSRTVAVGSTVTWTNKDATTHTVTSGTTGHPDGVFDSGNLSQNGTFSFTFNQAGTYHFYCRIHSSMSGTIIVQ
jgi:plastocyanin